MNWIFLTLTASLIEAISAIFGRFAIKHESSNTDLIILLWAYLAGIMFTLPGLIVGVITFNPIIASMALICAPCYLIAERFYYKSLSKSEVSRIVPIISLNPIFILIGATILFGEIHQPSRYIGMALILFGIILNSWDQQKHHLIDRKAIFWGILAALCFAIKSLGANWLSLLQYNPLNILFWIGLSLLIISIPLTFHVFYKIKKSKQKISAPILANLCVAATLEASSNLLFTAAVSIGPVAIIAFLDRLELLFVFILSSFLDFFRPQLLREKFVKEAFFQKFSAVVIVLIGSYFLI